MTNVSIAQKWVLSGGESTAGHFFSHTSYSGAYLLPVPLPMYQVLTTKGANYHIGCWLRSPSYLHLWSSRPAVW